MITISQIPVLRNAGDIQQVPFQENGEKLVYLNGLNHERIIAYSKAFQAGIKGSIEKVYVREAVYERLIQVAESLPFGYKLVVWETYTPRALQETIRKTTVQDISTIAHMTGAGIDVTLAERDGNLLPMGSGLNDDEPEKNRTLYFEELEKQGIFLTEDQEIARDHRRILFYAMSQAGFTNNPNDWFHWDYGNRWWASIKNTTAFYGPIDL